MSATRREDVDWLRIAAVWLLIPFHVAMVFNPAPFYHVRNHEVSTAMLVFAGFVGLWHMPLLFLLAGWSLHASLARREGREVLRERVARLVVPLACGVLLYAPVIKYLELRGGQDFNVRGLHVRADLAASYRSVIDVALPEMPPFEESFWTFLPTFFTHLERFTWSHLWFLAYLFTFTALYLPALVRLTRRPPPARAVAAWVVYTPLAVLVPIQVLLRPHWPGVQNLYDDWANFSYYTTFLVVGFLLARDAGFERAVHGERRRALAGAAFVLVVLILGLAGVVRSPSVILAGTAVAGWCLIVAILGFAASWLRRPAAALPYLRDGAMPVYVLHQPVVVVLAWAIVGLPLGIAAKFVLLLAAATVGTAAAYELVVRRIGPLRVAHGMRRTS